MKLDFDKPPQSVLVIVPRRIGDVLLATPVVRSLKRAWPATHIDMLVFSGTGGFIAGNDDVQHVLTIAERPRLLEHLKLVTRIARRYDLALSLVPGDRPTLYAWLAGRRRAGLLVDAPQARWKQHLLDAWVPFDNDATHTVRMHLALLETVGVAPLAEVVPSWRTEDEAGVRALLAPIALAPYAVLHPFPKFRYKMWSEDGWAEVGRWLQGRRIRVVLTGGPDAAERAYVARIADRIPGALDLAGRISLGGVAYAISGAVAYLGPDTAITHAAAALGVPTVALFGPTNPVKWGPWPEGSRVGANPWRPKGVQSSGNVTLVQGAGPCVPCGYEGCERHVDSASECLNSLQPATVIAALELLLSRAAPPIGTER